MWLWKYTENWEICFPLRLYKFSWKCASPINIAFQVLSFEGDSAGEFESVLKLRNLIKSFWEKVKTQKGTKEALLHSTTFPTEILSTSNNFGRSYQWELAFVTIPYNVLIQIVTLNYRHNNYYHLLRPLF